MPQIDGPKVEQSDKQKHPKRRLTFKQKKFTEEFLKSGNATSAAKKSYNVKNRQSASVAGYAALKSPTVQRYMAKVLSDKGVTDEKIAEKLQDLIDAGTTDRALKTATPDVALKAITFAAKLKDIVPADKKQIQKQSLTLSLQGKSEDELKEMLETLGKEVTSFSKMMKKE